MGTETVMRALGDQQWLDDAATPIQKVIRELAGAVPELKKILHGSFLGHPLHPALIDLPLGSWTLAAILDGIELARGSKKGAGDTAIGIGLAGAVAAAITGATDWSETDGRAKNIGLAHGVLNLSAASLYAASLILRKKRARQKGIGISMIAFGIAMTAAYMGGHLVYGEQIGVDHTATADQNQPEKFTAVLAENELAEDKPTKVVANGVAILLVKRGDTIHALRDTCTHLGGPLSEGKLEGDSIRCPWHGSRFCLTDGSVLDGPAVFPERLFDVRLRDGQIEVRARKTGP